MIQAPQFDFQVPAGYRWLLERGLVGFTEFSQLQPWYFLPDGESFDVTSRWPNGPSSTAQLVAFAKRQDCDDLACFVVEHGAVVRIALIHGWTPDGYSIDSSFGDIWDWLQSVVKDIRNWVEVSE